MATDGKCQYELDRDKRIAENKRKMLELGVLDAAAALASSKPAPKKQKKAKAAPSTDVGERRVSSRDRKVVNYCELETRTAREPRAPVDHSERIKAMTLDKETAEQLRKQAQAKKAAAKKTSSGPRGPQDSGKGVRVVGGKVYDSALGITCHWCRQKTLEKTVTCTNPSCGGNRRMPYSFCAKCLYNRHGEDCAAAILSEEWWCPACRGTCGPGCVACCNCGFCRKKVGLDATNQVVFLARDEGFSNVHDYLVHLVTGETEEAIAARKLQFPWGQWIKTGGIGKAKWLAKKAAEAAKKAAAAAAGGCGEGCSSGEHSHGAKAVSSLSDDLDMEGDKDQAPTSAPARRGRGARAGKAAAAAAAKGAAKGGADKGAAAAAKGGADKAPAGKRGRKAAAAAAAAAVPEVPAKEVASEEPEEDDDVPMLASQDMSGMTRKQRIMLTLGLADDTVVTKPRKA